jgi:hypothetical protein
MHVCAQTDKRSYRYKYTYTQKCVYTRTHVHVHVYMYLCAFDAHNRPRPNGAQTILPRNLPHTQTHASKRKLDTSTECTVHGYTQVWYVNDYGYVHVYAYACACTCMYVLPAHAQLQHVYAYALMYAAHTQVWQIGVKHPCSALCAFPDDVCKHYAAAHDRYTTHTYTHTHTHIYMTGTLHIRTHTHTYI